MSAGAHPPPPTRRTHHVVADAVRVAREREQPHAAVDERHEQRLADLQVREAACVALIERLQQRREEIVAAIQARRGVRDSSQVDLEREPLLAAARGSRPSRWGRVGWAWRIVLLAILVSPQLTMVSWTFMSILFSLA